MKDLGTKSKELYDSPSTAENKNKVVYPEIDFPLSFVKGMELEVGDNVDIHIKGRVSGLQDTKWSQRATFEAKQGEVKKLGKDGESILAEA